MPSRFVAAVLCLLAVLGAPSAMAEKVVPVTKVQVQLSYAPLVKKVAPAVVNIYTRKTVKARQVAPLFDDPFFRRFFGDQFSVPSSRKKKKKVQNSLGSGVVVRPDGIVVTNRHVIEGADEISVVLADRREFVAEILGADESTDLAVLRIDTGGEPLPALKLRDSDELEVGDLVLAIGNPFGVGQTVTSGIVSGLARTGVGVSDLGFFIQTDAAINPGNSGGALITMDGRLVGINTAIFTKSGGSHGIGFAIPTQMVRFVVAGFLKGKELVRPWLGASGQQVTADIADSMGLKRPTGVLVSDVYPNSPAARAGLRRGDVVLQVGGKHVEDAAALKFRIGTREVGGNVSLRVWRSDRAIDMTLALLPPPEVPKRDRTELSGRHPLNGATVVNMNPALSVELGIDGFRTGVYVLGLDKRGAAVRFGFRPGDRIVAVNEGPIETVRELVVALDSSSDGWKVQVDRGGRTLSVSIGQ